MTSKKVWIAGGALIAIGAIGYVMYNGAPASKDAAGTIVEAKRARADGSNSFNPTPDASTTDANKRMDDGRSKLDEYGHDKHELLGTSNRGELGKTEDKGKDFGKDFGKTEDKGKDFGKDFGKTEDKGKDFGKDFGSSKTE